MYQNYNIKQVCLPIDLETKLEKNDFAHAIVQFVDSIPDAVFLPYYQSMGRPQYHPRMLLSVILCAYIQGVYSGRQIQNMLIVFGCATYLKTKSLTFVPLIVFAFTRL